MHVLLAAGVILLGQVVPWHLAATPVSQVVLPEPSEPDSEYDGPVFAPLPAANLGGDDDIPTIEFPAEPDNPEYLKRLEARKTATKTAEPRAAATAAQPYRVLRRWVVSDGASVAPVTPPATVVEVMPFTSTPSIEVIPFTSSPTFPAASWPAPAVSTSPAAMLPLAPGGT